MYLEAMGQFVRSNVHAALAGLGGKAAGEDGALPADVRCAVIFVEHVCQLTRISSEDYVPAGVGLREGEL